MEKDAIIISAVGDLGLIGRISENIETLGTDHPFYHVADEFKSADIVFGNLEMPFCDDVTEQLRAYQSRNFFHSSGAIESLKHAGFSILSLANNHIMECGKQGLEKTIDVLSSNSIKFVGAGKNIIEARRPAIFNVRGTKIGFLAYAMKSKDSATFSSSGVAPIEIGLIMEDVAEVRKECDFVIVSLHFGLMYTELPSPNDVELCHRIVNSGVDVILGHHPHVLQGIEEYNGGLICYSLGEFVFDRMAGVRFVELGSENRRESLILKLYFKKGQPIRYNLLPTFFADNYQVEIAGRDFGLKILNRLDKLSAKICAVQDFYKEAGSHLVGYEIGGIIHHIKNCNFRYLFVKLKNIRWKHFRLLLGFIKSKIV